MGQRLVITIHAFNEDVAKIYYHWSGYSVSALCEASDIIKGVKYKDATSVSQLQLMLIRHVEKNGGGINHDDTLCEFGAIQQMFPGETFNLDVNRSNGLIALTGNGMDDLQRWSEGDVTIDFDEEEIFNSVWCLESPETIVEIYGGRPKVPRLKHSIEDIKFDELIKELTKAIDAGYYFVYSNGIYAGLIA